MAKAKAARVVQGKAKIPIADSNDDESSKPRFQPKDLPYFGDFEELAEIDGEVEELRDLTLRAAKIKEQIEDQKAIIQDLMESVPINGRASYSVRITEELGIAYIKATKPGEKLVRELLILAGVTEKQLKKGTKKTAPNKPYVQLLLPTKAQKEAKMKREAQEARGE